jgi:hypothetical protein
MAKGWAEFVENPRHWRARLLEPTQMGRSVVAPLRDEQTAWSDGVGSEVGLQDLKREIDLLSRVILGSRRYRIQQ